MRKFVVTLMASLLSCSAVFAFWPEATESSLEVGVGYRQDKLEWRTSSSLDSSSSSSYEDYSPELHSKLQSKVKWHDLQIWQIEAKGKYITCDNIYLRGNADYGWITNGKNSDSDSQHLSFSNLNHASGSESVELSNSKSRARGHVYDARVAVGYQFKMCDDSFAVAPLVGYSWHGMYLKHHHAHKHSHSYDDTSVESYVLEDSYDSSYASSESYDSSYASSNVKGRNKSHTRWNGPFIGFDFDYRFGCGCEADWELFGTYEFHWAQFHGKGHSNNPLESNKGFHNKADNGYGQIVDVGVKWDFCDSWTVALKGEFQWFWAPRGTSYSRVLDESEGSIQKICDIKIPARDIKWTSASISVDVGMVF